MDLGLTAICKATELLLVTENWLQQLPDDASELSAMFAPVSLTDTHLADLNFLNASYREREGVAVHTARLKQLHRELRKPGVFDTISPATDLDKPNAFMFPREGGWWMVYRFGKGTPEAASWNQDGIGWTRCAFGRSASLAEAAAAAGAVEIENGFSLPNDDSFAVFTAALGIDLAPAGGPYTVKKKKRKVSIKTPYYGGAVPFGWGVDGRWLVRVFSDPTPPLNPDHLVRSYRTEDGKDVGYGFFADDGQLHMGQRQQVSDVLGARGIEKPADMLGRAASRPWTVVNEPFGPEYPGGRRQNLFSPKLADTPERNPNPTPTWDRILAHIGRGLDDAVREDDWCRRHKINTGADWLFLWIALLFQMPSRSSPYLFLYGLQNAGKSTLADAIRLLVVKGVVEADEALTSSSTFNGSLLGAVLCLIEETFISDSKTAYTRLKKWTTANQLTVRRMYCEPIEVPNYCHFIQTANDVAACPVFEGDSRIVMIEVAALPPGDRVDWPELKERLIAERADFLGRLFNAELPPPEGRLYLPVLETESKRRAVSTASSAKPDLLTALKPLAGRTMKTSEVFEALPEGIAASVAALGKLLRAVGAELVGRSTWHIPETLF